MEIERLPGLLKALTGRCGDDAGDRR